MNGTEETRDLWKEITGIKEDLTEIKTTLKALPEKLNYYYLVNNNLHTENCDGRHKAFENEKRIDNIEIRLEVVEKTDDNHTKTWSDIKKSITSSIIGALIAGLIFLMALGVKSYLTDDKPTNTNNVKTTNK